MPPSPAPGVAALSRRRFLAAAGILALAAGCTATEPKKPPVSAKQTDQLEQQVRVQRDLLAAFAAAAAADPALGARVADLADLADQARQQLQKLEEAAPGAARTSAAPSASGSASGAAASGSAAPAPPAGADVRSWLGQQVTAAASSHAEACLDQTGARAALLGSISAGLRGQQSRLS